MSKRTRRIGLLLGLIAFAAVWVIVLGLGADPASSIITNTTTSSGDTVSIRFIDQAGFPARITTFLKIADKAGDVIRNLPVENFSLSEDGTPVEIKEFIGAGDQPLTVILVIDTSGSMDEEGKMEGAKDAAISFLDNAKPNVDAIGVIEFNSIVQELGPLQKVSQSDLDLLKTRIRGLAPNGSTQFYASTQEAIDRLKNKPGRRAVITLTDGRDDSQSCLFFIFCSTDTFDEMLASAKDAEITLYTIGLGSDLDQERMSKMAAETNGEFYEAPTSAQLTELYRKIAAGLADEYSLAYDSPTPKRDGTRRAIQVNIKLPTGATTTAGSYSVPGVLTANSNVPLFLGLLLPLLALLGVPPVLRRLPKRRIADEPYVNRDGRHDPPVNLQPPTLRPAVPIVPPPPLQHQSPPYVPPIAPPIVPPQTADTLPCPKCATPTKLSSRFCAACGQEVELCPNCGRRLARRGARFCGSCGHQTAQVRQTA